MPASRIAAAWVVALALAGCSPAERHPDRLPVVPTRGAVEAGGKPAAGALLVFHPSAGSALPALPRATVGPDGTFAVGTYESADGLPAGQYTVSVIWETPPPDGDESKAGPSRISAKYARKESSGLTATVAPGADGACELPPIKLTK